MKIKQLEINSFRGIPEKLVIDFPIQKNKPASLIILGDNGVGKSSIVDAVEFCLQGHISQSKSLDAHALPSVKSFYTKNLPLVIITLENGEIVKRELIVDEQGLLLNIKYPHELFAISPFVLRRHDILRFINSSEAERTLVFSNYLRDGSVPDWVEHPIDELKRLQDERLLAKHHRDSLIKSLAHELGIDVEEIPFDRKGFNDFVKEKIYKGIPKNQFEAKGYKVKLNEKAIELASKVYDAMENHRKIKNQINAFSLNADVKKFPKHLLDQLENTLIKVSQKLTSSFLEISPLPFIEKIEISYDISDVLALSLTLVLKNNRKCSPNQLLSEANLDLLALLFFLSFIHESAERGQSKFIILDDVLQSVDSTIRVSILSHLLKNMSDWQYIITVHDRLWYRQVKDLMNLYGHPFFNLSIVGWTFESGPQLRAISLNNDEMLNSALEEKNLINICSASGLLLEEMSDALSKSLNTSVQRRKDDIYTLADLFPGVAKVLKKTRIKEEVEEVEKWIHLRNLIGAHYNEWALALSLVEAGSFGIAVISLFNEYPTKEQEHLILKKMARSAPQIIVEPVMSPADIKRLRELCDDIYMDEKIEEYIVNLVEASRNPDTYGLDIGQLIRYGASPRATIFLAMASKANALIEGRGYVTPQDVKSVAMNVLRHRVVVTYEAEAEEKTSEDVVKQILQGVDVP